MSSKPSKIDPKDFTKKTKWELQAEQDEKIQAKAESVAKKLFDPAKLTELVNTIHEENDPYLGLIRYGELSLHDAFIIEKCKSDAEKTSMAAYLMLKKGNPSMPTYTPENISEWQKTMPMAEGALLLMFIRKAPAFLRTQSLPGLIQAETPKTSL